MRNTDPQTAQETLDRLKEALDEKKRTRGEDHPETFSAMRSLAIALLDMGQNIEAIAILQELHLRQKRVFGTKDPDTKDTEQLLGLLHSLRR